MCKSIAKIVQRDIFKGHDPTQEYLDGQMPTYTVRNLIKHLEYRMMIHETYYAKLIQGETNYYYGDAAFHQWACEGYSNSIYYLKKLMELQNAN